MSGVDFKIEVQVVLADLEEWWDSWSSHMVSRILTQWFSVGSMGRSKVGSIEGL